MACKSLIINGSYTTVIMGRDTSNNDPRAMPLAEFIEETITMLVSCPIKEIV